MATSKTYYDILDVPPDASHDDIRSAFRLAAKRYHPDLSPSYVQKLRATIRMQELNEAYSVLRDPRRRRAYDAALSGPNLDVPDISFDPAGEVSWRPRTSPTPIVVGQTPGVSRARSLDPVTAWMTFVWILASVAYGYALWNAGQSQAWGGLLFSIAVALVVTPMLLMVLGLVLTIPIGILWLAFVRGVERHREPRPSSIWVVLRDMVLRLLGLAAVVGGAGLAWRFVVTSEFLFVALLSIGGGLLGEIAAMIGYLCRRSVVRTTEAMLRRDIVPLGAHSNGV